MSIQKPTLKIKIMILILIIEVFAGVQSNAKEPGKVITTFESSVTNGKGLAWNEGYLWQIEDGNIYRTHPVKGDKVKVTSLLSQGCNGLTFGMGALWVIDTSQNKVYRLNPGDGELQETLNLRGAGYQDIVYMHDCLFLTKVDGNIEKFNLKTRSISDSFSAPLKGKHNITSDGESLWYVCQEKIYRLEGSDGTITLSFSLPKGEPEGLAYGNENLWYATADGLVHEIYVGKPERGVVEKMKQAHGVGVDPKQTGARRKGTKDEQ